MKFEVLANGDGDFIESGSCLNVLEIADLRDSLSGLEGALYCNHYFCAGLRLHQAFRIEFRRRKNRTVLMFAGRRRKDRYEEQPSADNRETRDIVSLRPSPALFFVCLSSRSRNLRRARLFLEPIVINDVFRKANIRTARCPLVERRSSTKF